MLWDQREIILIKEDINIISLSILSQDNEFLKLIIDFYGKLWIYKCLKNQEHVFSQTDLY